MTRNSPRVLALISARGGSKGLHNKNVIDLGGKPLIAWTILAALEAKCVTDIVLSSDSEEIMEIAKNFGCDVPFKRPANLAQDTSQIIDVVLHALDTLPRHGYPAYEYVLLLQPTSPMRTSFDIDNAFELMHLQSAPSCVSVCEVDTSPFLMYRFDVNFQIRPILPNVGMSLRRQDLPVSYQLNGAVYFANPTELRATKSFTSDATVGYIMPRERSTDIDTIDDLEIVRKQITKNVSTLDLDP